jgi:predicted ferric reductase
VHVLDSSLLHLEIPTSLQWSPGQHYFFRFLLGEGDLHRFSSHPFTVASVAEAGKIELIVKVRHGITLRLAELDSVPVLLDGPYGGLQGRAEAYDHVLLIAGGSGESSLLTAHSVMS